MDTAPVTAPYDAMLGSTLAGRYQLLDILGIGGMGVVFKARNTQLDALVCIKILRDPVLSDNVALRRMQSEARALANLEHPHVLRVIAMENDGSHFFLVTEYIDGIGLDKVIAQQKLAPERVRQIFAQIAFGLEYAHSHNIIHRDLKPSNIILQSTESGQVAKILDFGIAKQLDSETMQALTKSGTFVGTPQYIAPEQCTGGLVDKRSDIYSLGCMLYECLSGKPPFQGDTAMEVMMKHTTEPAPIISGSLGAVSATAMAKDPAQRFQTMEEFSAALVDKTYKSAPRAVARRARKFANARTVTVAVTAFAIMSVIAFFLPSEQNKISLPQYTRQDFFPNRGTASLVQDLKYWRDSDNGLHDPNYEKAALTVLSRPDAPPSAISCAADFYGCYLREHKRDHKLAKKWFEAAVAIANSERTVNTHAANELSWELVLEDKFDAATEMLKHQYAMLERYPDSKLRDSSLHVALARCLAAGGKNHEADPYYAKAVSCLEFGKDAHARIFHARLSNLLMSSDPKDKELASELLSAYQREILTLSNTREFVWDELEFAKAEANGPDALKAFQLTMQNKTMQRKPEDALGHSLLWGGIVQTVRANVPYYAYIVNDKASDAELHDARTRLKEAVNSLSEVNQKFDRYRAQQLLKQVDAIEAARRRS